MQVGPESPPDAAALIPGLAVVPEPSHDAPERFGTRVELRPACVILETGGRLPNTGFELTLEQHVADHSPLARDRLVWKEAYTFHTSAFASEVAAAEQLI